jgi:hypothetical protein
MKVGFEFGVARVTSVNQHGALAEIDGDLDACEPTQIEALRAVEAKLVAALSDVRSLIYTLEATR